MKYDVDYFIKKFEAIPESEWGVNSINNQCAYYHCDNDKTSYQTEIKKAFTNLLAPNYTMLKELVITRINDGSDLNYQQPTPKQRILAALYDIKKAQEPKHEDIRKELAVLPTEEVIDVKIKELVN